MLKIQNLNSEEKHMNLHILIKIHMSDLKINKVYKDL